MLDIYVCTGNAYGHWGGIEVLRTNQMSQVKGTVTPKSEGRWQNIVKKMGKN